MKLPCRRSVTRPARRSLARCWLTAVGLAPASSARQDTDDSPWASAHRIFMRAGSASRRRLAAARRTASSGGIRNPSRPACMRRYYRRGSHTDTSRPRHDEGEHRRAANRAVGVSALGLAVTGLIELALAVVTGSVALLGDALHNLSDVSTSAVVFLGFRISKRPATDRYPYGFERAEDLAGLGVAVIIWASAVFAGIE